MVKKATKLRAVPNPVTKLDLGCGKSKKEGFHGVDMRPFEGVDTVLDLGRDTWPWADGSIEEVHCAHFLEHLAAPERIHFVNELWRVMAPGAKAMVITPHWASHRAYGDLSHQWPPVSEMWFYYLNREWREQNAPHNDFYKCDFQCVWGWALHPEIAPRNQQYQEHALKFWKEAALDTICTMTKPSDAKT